VELQSNSCVDLYVLCEVSPGLSFKVPIILTSSSILPALAFSLDMFVKTNSTYGVNEVLLSSVLAAVVFSLFAAQPLTIVGVTGPITVFNYTVFDIMASRTNYLSFMCWIGM
jgi:boron transporter